MERIQLISPADLRPNPRNARRHSKKQIRQIADSIMAYGFTVPVLVDEKGMLLAGHGRLEAAKLLGLKTVPVIKLVGLTEAKKRALLLADNKIAENAGWDRKRLAVELPELAELLIDDQLEISITGFEPAEIDQLTTDFEANDSDPADTVDDQPTASVVTKPGDLWLLGDHRILCGDARSEPDLNRLMGDRASRGGVSRPALQRQHQGRGWAWTQKARRIRHGFGRDVATESSSAFLIETLGNAATYSREGAVHYVCMDWRHLGELIEAGANLRRDAQSGGLGQVQCGSGKLLPFAARIDRRVSGGEGSSP